MRVSIKKAIAKAIVVLHGFFCQLDNITPSFFSSTLDFRQKNGFYSRKQSAGER
ncbi:MAG: hypothetical protein F6J93_15720 [Oscillatoria sp. SIO1A7]|nr:hypothetical protein [Oscillatoria sp. SIO1A7]